MSNTAFNTYKNVFGQTLIIAPVNIANGDTASSYLDCGNVANLGVGSPRRLILPANFLTNVVTFETAEDIGNNTPGDFMLYYFNDGINTAPPMITPPNGESNQGFPANWLDSVRFIRLVLNVAATADFTIGIALEPMYQGST